MSEASSNTDLVEQLADEFLDRRQQGERLSVADFCDLYPKVADELRILLTTMELMEEFPSAAVGSTGTRSHELDIDEIGGYRIIKEIGRGGMGVVYEAEHVALRRRVALKVLPRQTARSQSAKLRFEREARAAAKMHHTNIVPVFEVGNENSYFFYAMQLINGHGLDQLIADMKNASSKSQTESLKASSAVFNLQTDSSNSSSARALNKDTSSGSSGDEIFRSIARIGLQTAEALSYSHVRGIVHRDVKPSNILLDENGIAWLTDFGLAKVAEEELTQTGDFVGTLRYMAPERFRDQCDARADIYALGLTLYELIVMEPAFQSNDRLELINLIGKSTPPPLRAKNARAPRDLETIITKAIDPDLKLRYQDSAELAEDLRSFLSDQPIRARRQSSFERLYRWSRRNKGFAAAISFSAILLAALAAVSTLSSIKQANLRAIAEGHSEELLSSGEQLQRTLYYAEMNLGAALASGEAGIDQVEELTANWIPKTGGRDLRGWEWYFLRSLAGSEMQVLERHDGEVWSVHWNPNRSLIASSSLDGSVLIFDADSHDVLHRLSHPKQVWSATWSPNGTQLATSCDDGKIRIWDANSWSNSKTIDTGKIMLAPSTGVPMGSDWLRAVPAKWLKSGTLHRD